MNISTYRAQQAARREAEPKRRQYCDQCQQPLFGCYCAHVRPFDPGFQFTILMHPIERKRRIATGRMAHLCLQGSKLIVGEEFGGDRQVQALIDDPSLHSVVLYPGRLSVDLSALSTEQRLAQFSNGRKLNVFIIDGTWATARKMMHRSENLKRLPRFAFTPTAPSRFRVRKQPEGHCLSTIEAVHELIQLIGPPNRSDSPQDNLLEVFDLMVERQLKAIDRFRRYDERSSYRRPAFT